MCGRRVCAVAIESGIFIRLSLEAEPDRLSLEVEPERRALASMPERAPRSSESCTWAL